MLKSIALAGASLILLVALALGLLLVFAPWLDGPVLHIAGGPFSQVPVDFSELKPARLRDAPVVEIEVQNLPRPSIMIGVLVLRNEIFVPATLSPEEKRWPKAIENDPRIRLRFENKVVDAFAYRVTDHDLHRTLSELGAEKYGASYFQPEKTWYFRVTSAPG